MKSVAAGRKSSMAIKFCIMIVLLIVAVFVSMGVVNGNMLRKTNISVSRGYCEQLVETCAIEIDRQIALYAEKLRAYVVADVVRGGDTDEIAQWMFDSYDYMKNSEFDNVFYCTFDGVAHHDHGKDTQVKERQYFKDILLNGKGIVTDDPVIGKHNGLPVYHVARPAYDSAGKLIGMFVATILTDDLQKITDTHRIGSDGYSFMIKRDGTVITHPDKSYVMSQNIFETQKELASAVAQSAKGSVIVTDSATKKRFLNTYAPIGNTGWIFVFAVPEAQIQEPMRVAGSIVFVVCCISALVLVLFSGFFISIALRPLNTLGKEIEQIAKGEADLTRKVTVQTRDEIGMFAEGFNSFVLKLRSIITQIKSSRDSLKMCGGGLVENSSDVNTSVSKILDDIQDMDGLVKSQFEDVSDTVGAMSQIAAGITALDQMIASQSRSIEETAAAVRQEIGTISSVSNSVITLSQKFENLQEKAQDGSRQQDSMKERIGQIESQSNLLQDANLAIAGIAEQTNLLAMNAAIEAAHAGESGKGFSVVADEIRKLSETSSEQSKTIGSQLEKIRESISLFVSASVASDEAFKMLAVGIEESCRMMMHIKGVLEEQQSGSSRIEASLYSMDNVTMDVKTSSREMSAAGASISERVKRLQENTVSIRSHVEGMGGNAMNIRRNSESLQEVIAHVESVIAAINTQVDQFKV